MDTMVERAHIAVRGVVQGVGFRPFVFRLARDLDLNGYVINTDDGVVIEIEGVRVPEFTQRLRAEAPPLARITDFAVTGLPAQGYAGFAIRQSCESAGRAPFTLVSPDMSVCGDCLRELFDPADRRYLYPFINCTNCGPRYSITRSVPYDRPNTTMADFVLCPECRREYHDPGDRRFHAQPNACPVCGPRVAFQAPGPGSGPDESAGPIAAAINLLKQGGIVAVKGLGGFHLACDAANDAAVRQLRERKRKSNKPFGVMAADIRSLEAYCCVSTGEKDLLLSPRRPMVLLTKDPHAALSPDLSPHNRHIGCMLPYTPLHYLLFHHPPAGGRPLAEPHFKALVMTSGNLAEEPIVRDNDEALKKFSHIADGFLFHNREIFMRVDDSVVRTGRRVRGVPNDGTPSPTSGNGFFFIRRSRGYAPDPIPLRDDGPEVLGCGADLKNTFTLTKGKFAIPSQHIGDMANYEALRFFEECLANLKAVYRAEPAALGHDLHPGYLTTGWAMERAQDSKIRVFGIQHHYAHIGSVMAEHGLRENVIGVAFDGTGYGTDGCLWGGEFLIAGIAGFERAGRIKYIPLPGGEAAIREPWRSAVSHVMDAAGEGAAELLRRIGFVRKYGKTLEQVMQVARSHEFSPLSSGAGRLFDAMSALLGLCDRNTFEGEAAMALESVAREGIEEAYPVAFTDDEGCTVLDFSPVILAAIADLRSRTPRGIIAARFHNALISAIRAVVRKIRCRSGSTDVALSGGTFQNVYLLERVAGGLSRDGMTVYLNRKVPCNDACISLGQAYLVRERLKRG